MVPPKIEIPRIRESGDFFPTGSPGWDDALIDVFRPTWFTYAEGYRLAADALVDRAIAIRHERDLLIYPLLFLYRHFLELSLKQILKYVEELSEVDEVSKIDKHGLDYLLDRINSSWKAGTDGSIEKEYMVIKSAVAAFSRLDPTSELFRYPEKRDGTTVEHPHGRVNLSALRSEMENASLAIDIVSGGLSAHVDLRRDWLHDMGGP